MHHEEVVLFVPDRFSPPGKAFFLYNDYISVCSSRFSATVNVQSVDFLIIAVK